MKTLEFVLVALCISSIFLSSFSLYLAWRSQPNPTQSYDWIYSVTAFPEDQYRIYVMVNSQTVIADEYAEYKMYPLYVQEGDKIEIHAYSNVSFTVTLEDNYNPVETETGTAISILYTVIAP